MAKKAKKKKAGMLKRKQNKQTKKASQRRMHARRSPQNPSSQRELQKLLQKLPYLAYEEEFAEVQFDQQAIQDLRNGGSGDPEIIVALTTPEFISDMRSRLEEMEERVATQPQKALMVKGMLYSLDGDQMPHVINPLIVAIYLKSKAALDGQELENSEILKAVAKYEENNEEMIGNIVEAIQAIQKMTDESNELSQDAEYIQETDGRVILGDMPGSNDDVIEGTLEGEPTDVEPEAPPSVDAEVLETYYDTLSDFDEEIQERMQEDVEVFVEDYATTPPAEWDARMVHRFMLTWFPNNLNPVADDFDSMRSSLDHFFKYLGEQGHISNDSLPTLLEALQDPNA